MRGSWEELYQAALIENDRENLTRLVGAVEAAIVRRRRELTNVRENDREFAGMVLAAQDILTIKSARLGWPPVGPNANPNQSLDVFDKIRRVESIHHWHR
jgi:hypothetical protein